WCRRGGSWQYSDNQNEPQGITFSCQVSAVAPAAALRTPGDQPVIGVVQAYPGAEPVLAGLQAVALAGAEVVIIQGQAAVAAQRRRRADVAGIDLEVVAHRQLVGAGREHEVVPGPGRTVQLQGQQTVGGGALQIDPGALAVKAGEQGASGQDEQAQTQQGDAHGGLRSTA